jgi:hypothetical protein
MFPGWALNLTVIFDFPGAISSGYHMNIYDCLLSSRNVSVTIFFSLS